ncbi:hypothetical protein GGS21DRAFT_499922 [Xylaria nigripes]|nr:hypothetical protein GGS21DRAFT_499922 [Xylaria nigripes]
MSAATRIPADAASLEEKVTSTVNGIVGIAIGIGSSLANIEHNTRENFWWTSWSIVIVLGLFILHLLVRVRAQLMQLNRFQAEFQRMWVEDRENDDRIRREERRERHIKELKEERARGDKLNAAAGQQSQARMRHYINELIDDVEPIPAVGTPEYEEYLEDLRGALQR